MINNKRGISLIILIITIIVVIILASAIILSFKEKNPINRANEVKFKADLDSFRNELLNKHNENEIKNFEYVRGDINADAGDYIKMKVFIPDITKDYSKILAIKNGRLVYVDKTNPNYDENESKYAEEIGIGTSYKYKGDVNGDGFINEEDAEFMIQYENSSEDKPYDPTDIQFKAMDIDGDGIITYADYTVCRAIISSGEKVEL